MARPKGSPSINKSAPPKGRPRGSLDRQSRTLVGAELAADILNTYKLMTYKGCTGPMALLRWSEDNPAIFFTQILSRLMPAPQKADGDDSPLVNINLGAGGDLEAGRRIAFVLARAAHLQGDDPVKDRVPYAHLAREETDSE